MDNSSRAFLYGESVFTTMRMISGEVKDWDLHFDRLKRGIDFVFGPIDDSLWLPFKLMIEEKTKRLSGSKALRVTVFARGDIGFKPLKANLEELEVVITERPLPDLDLRPRRLKSVRRPGRPNFWPSFLKAGSYLETLLTQKYMLNSGDDDLLFCDESGNIEESSVANIFIVQGTTLITPALGPNVLEGITRKKVLDVAPLFFDKTSEESISLNEKFHADGIFLSNSIRGIFLVDRIDDFEISYSEKFLKTFNELREMVLR